MKVNKIHFLGEIRKGYMEFAFFLSVHFILNNWKLYYIVIAFACGEDVTLTYLTQAMNKVTCQESTPIRGDETEQQKKNPAQLYSS
jgi:hypothetical protein